MVGVRIPDDLREWLKEQVRRNRTSLSHYIVMLILKEMEKNGGDSD